jgi:hypothetical protein
MKPSERILAYCAVVLTFLALTIWLKFFEFRPRTAERPPETVRQMARPARKKPTAGKNVQPASMAASSAETALPSATEADSLKPQSNPASEPRTVVVSHRKTPATAATMLAVTFSDGAIIHGKVLLRGPVPPRKKLKLDADPRCAAIHATEPPLSEEVIVNEAGALQNVFVYIAGGLEGRTFETPKEPVMLDQRGCAFVPHVLGMQARQLLLLHNSDDTTHNIHALTSNNPEFNNGQPARSADLKKTFAKPEVMIPMKCDLHSWMHAFIGVLDHPYFSVTGAEGTFAFPPLPAGTYTFAVWHEKYGAATQIVTVHKSEDKELDFVFESQ